MRNIITIIKVFTFGAIFASSNANAVTIDQYDALGQNVKNKVVSMTLQGLLGATAKKSGASTNCMVQAFTTFNVSAGEKAPHGINLIVAQLKVQRELGKVSQTHVEDVVQTVYEAILQDRCMKPDTQTAQ